jgi:divalent metal cation (Fe/Co/Zn/Cd) transporter
MRNEIPLQFTPIRNASDIRAGVRLEILTVVWMLIEAVVGIAAGVLASSVLLTAFGFDSVIELISGGTLLWRLNTEARGGSLAHVELSELRAAWITGLLLLLLCLYVVVTSAVSVVLAIHPESSILGLLFALSAVVFMPMLAWRKRVIAGRIDSAALRSDAACSITCAYMAGALLVGLLLNELFGWWWADVIAALGLLAWLIPETREALSNARAGRAACSCCD